MSRLSQPLIATVGLAALCLITISCASINLAQVRVINAMPDSTPVDIYFNGHKLVSALPFGGVYPAPATPVNYTTVTSGTQSVDGFPPGDVVNPTSPFGTLLLNGSTQYTILAVGLQASETPPLAVVDNNTAPTAGTVEYRIIDASLNSPPKGLDVYFVPPGTDISKFTPQITGLGYEQSSTYELAPNAGGFSVIVTTNGGKTPIINQPSDAPAGSITTIVLLDNTGGTNGISQTPLVLTDLN